MKIKKCTCLDKRLSIGNTIRRLRLERNMTQEYLSQKMCQAKGMDNGGSAQAIYRIENGLTDYGIDTLIAVAEALDVPLVCLISEPDNALNHYFGVMPDDQQSLNHKILEMHTMLESINNMLLTLMNKNSTIM